MKITSIVDISIIVPVFNEEENIPVFYRKAKKILADLNKSWEFIFVNDGSGDRSAALLSALASKDVSVKYIDLTKNFGQQAALTAGMDHATGRAIITMDCDLQDPPEVIPEMIQKWTGGADIVYARRSHREDKFIKKYSALLYYKLLHKFSETKIAGNVGDFRLIDRKVLIALRGMREKSRYLRGMVAWLGYHFEIIDYKRPERIYGKTGFSLLKMIRLGMSGILNFSLLPLRLGLVIGMLTVFSGFGFIAYIAFDTLFFDTIYPLYKWLSVITFVFTGFLFIIIWILGEYVGSIHNEIKGRPIYVINKKENFSAEGGSASGGEEEYEYSDTEL